MDFRVPIRVTETTSAVVIVRRNVRKITVGAMRIDLQIAILERGHGFIGEDNGAGSGGAAQVAHGHIQRAGRIVFAGAVGQILPERTHLAVHRDAAQAHPVGGKQIV